MDKQKMTEHLKAIEKFFPRGYVIVGRHGDRDYLLHEFNPEQDKNLGIIGKGLQETMEEAAES